VSSRRFAATAKIGLAAFGAALAIAAIGGASSAQDKSKAAAAAAALPVTGAPAANDPAAAGSAQLDKGRDLFTNYGCGNCHTLGDAGATGHVGPALDGNANLSQDFIVGRVTNGQGMMPSFAGQMSADEINTLAAYIMKVAQK
jgi:mono/diheme cytochrome c family protein